MGFVYKYNLILNNEVITEILLSNIPCSNNLININSEDEVENENNIFYVNYIMGRNIYVSKYKELFI